jgi:hypothetical protein
MKRYHAAVALVSVCLLLALSVRIVHSQGKVAPSTVQVHMVITDQAFDDKSESAVLRPENLQAKVGKNVVKIEHLIPARADNAALQLFVLIDDTCDTSDLGSNLNDLREFIKAQPASTLIGIAYMSNATIQVAQNLTNDHALAAQALRLPRGSSSTMDSPYLSLVSLVKSWPQQKVRREVLMISDGIDRLRGDTTASSSFSSADISGRGFAPRPATTIPSTTPSTMPSISMDADTASNASQRYGVIVHSIYATGVGRLSRNAWEAQLGQSGVAKITDETGGEYFALGTQNAVSFKPYLDRLQKIFDNQYFLVLQVTPQKKEGLQRVRISTEVANADIASANSVWVPASGG